ncbi:MAG TPA: hypothetical protein VKE93_11135 [Candidatus Angelobacter sp.]|nr:hypothetical protein [Candidatus Angelobacter sp.]
MNPRIGKRVLIVLVVLMALVAARTGYIFYQRSRPMKTPAAAPANTYQPVVDDYVTSPKIFPYDLKSAAQEMVGKTVWVRAGNALPYYPYHAGTADLAHQAAVLPPLEKLVIKDVVLQRAPAALAPGQVAIVQKKVLAVVDRPGQSGNFAVVVGTNIGDNFEFTANDNFFFADPHELYKHWPAEVWTAIDQRQAKKGMNELQVGFALGVVRGATSGDYGNRMLQYRSGDSVINVTFENNRAVAIVENKD